MDKIKISLRFFYIFSIFAFSLSFAENEDCLDCHDDAEFTTERGNKVISLYVNPIIYNKSVHAEMECIDCHEDAELDEDDEHPERLDPVFCGNCHYVNGCFVSKVVAFVAQSYCLVDVFDVCCQPDHIYGAFVGGLKFLFGDTMCVDHYTELYVGFDTVNYFEDLFVVTVFPRSVLFRRREFSARAVTHFHVVDAGLREGFVNGTDKFVCEVVVVNESPVTNCAIQNFNFFSVHGIFSSYDLSRPFN